MTQSKVKMTESEYSDQVDKLDLAYCHQCQGYQTGVDAYVRFDDCPLCGAKGTVDGFQTMVHLGMIEIVRACGPNLTPRRIGGAIIVIPVVDEQRARINRTEQKVDELRAEWDKKPPRKESED